MQIKKRLQINVVVSVLMAFVICLVLFLSLVNLNKANNTSKIASELTTSVLERVTLRNDYMRNNSARAKEQWIAKHEQVGEILKSASENFRDSENRVNIAKMVENHESIGKIFSTIVTNREKSGLNADSADLTREVEERLLSQLNMRVYEAAIHGRKLQESSIKARASALRLAGGGVVSVLAILIAAAMISSWSMGRAITDRVARLRDGAVLIGGGDLDHRIDIKGDDEFVELSEAFNAMTARLSSSYHELENEIEERKRAEQALRESEERFRNMFEHHKAIMLLIEPESGAIVDANASAVGFYRHSREKLCSLKIQDINQAPADEVNAQRHKAVHEEQDHFVFPHLLATGEIRWVEVYSTPFLTHGKFLLFSIIHDITERREAEQERQLSMEFLHLVNESQGSDLLILAATDFFRKKSECEAVGIRLKEGDDYPYFEAQGFPEEFVLLENHLCEYNERGEVVRDSNGNPVIDCMCGNVICSRFDPAQPFFTSQGSFWSNCTTKLLASSTDADRQARTRNRCNGEGYESVALIPIGTVEERLGLLQLNDRRQGRFTARGIALWERLAAYLAVALSKFRAEEALRGTHDELAQQVEERTRDLREKEVMLKEIHHRVKNNLQVISSLVSLQADGSKDQAVLDVLKDVTYRVRSMALVHEKLYQSADLARIDFAEYTRSLLSYLWRAHGTLAASIRLTYDLEPVSLPIDTAIPCGLILNELAGNALKHAFRGLAGGEVTVALQSGVDGRIRLSVTDNGVGLPAGLDWSESRSLGLRLVQMLSGQLGADVQVSGGDGTRFEMFFEQKAED